MPKSSHEQPGPAAGADAPLHARPGVSVDASDPARLRRAVDMAFDYRGDVTIARRSGGEPVEGFVYDRRLGPDDAFIRVMPRDRAGEITIAVADIERIDFSGRDTAAGKSFDTWIRKYLEGKLAGEPVGLEPESLDEG